MFSTETTNINRSLITINEFLKHYEDKIEYNDQTTLSFDFDFSISQHSQKLCPIMQLAEPKDALEITQMFKEVYHGTYPYKKMENVEAVRSMINDSNFEIIVYKLGLNKIVGCLTVDFEFKKQLGILHGFLFNQQYQKIVDSLKACIGSLTYIWKMYKDKILIWLAEVRTKETAPQYFGSLCGLKPIAFYPNKDIFFNHIESDFLIITYDEKALRELRRNEAPKIIRQVLNCYSYSNKRYQLGMPIVENPKINLNSVIINQIKNKINQKKTPLEFGNQEVIFSIANSNSYFKFVYNTLINSIEKTEYKISNLEELFVFIENLKELIQKWDIRYFECFVSAYLPTHQKIFNDAGIKPRGYIPCLKYNNKNKYFEDLIVFNYYKGSLNQNIKLIPESEELLQILNFSKEKSIPEFSEVVQS